LKGAYRPCENRRAEVHAIEGLRRYGIAAALALAAWALRVATADRLGETGLFLTLYLAAAGAAVFGGLGPGLLATGLTALAAAFLLPPADSLWVERPEYRLLTAGFLAIGVLTSVLAERARRAQGRLVHSTEAERGSAARMQAVLQAAVDAVAIMDDEGRLEFVNPALEKTFGHSAQSLLGRNVNVLMAEPYHSEHDGYLAAYRATGRRKIIGLGREVVGRRSDGTTLPLHLSVSEVEVGGRRLFAGMMRDLTESKALEAQMLRAQKMESIGTLAGGIAHDFNNLLTAIEGSVELALMRPAGDPVVTRSLERVRLATARGEALTKQILGLSRKQVIRREDVDASAAVRRARELFERIVPEDISIAVDLDDDGWVRIDPGQLDQVILNLVVNARDAMPHGGELRLATHRRSLDAMQAAGWGLASGEYVTLSIGDDGEGIPDDVRDRIFEPFFTTKERGTGLGLAMVRQIVTEGGGGVAVRSEEGSGTVVEILLPRVAEPSVPEPAAPAPAVRPAATAATILLVEDDRANCELLREVLELDGHRVLAGQSAAAALEAAASERVHLLLTDVVMPGMTGFELAARLRNSGQPVRVIYMSGYTEQVIADRGGPLGPDDDFLRKPFGLDELRAKVGEALATRPRS
jgi:PAS domain S-box-containing protein